MTIAGLAVAQLALVLAGGVALATGVGGTDGCSVSQTDPGADILGCLRDQTAYVETPAGTGTALLLEDGHLVTNAHVVDPFDQATVTLGGTTHDDIDVVGVDLTADIAVLGPIDAEGDGIDVGGSDEVVDGGSLYLVGYPGELEADPEPTIAQGILSRRRNTDDFNLHYLQTDASIGGGQSGGALVNAGGEVVGISTLRFAEEFALSLSIEDAQRSIDKILAGDGDDVEAWPGNDSGPTQATTGLNDFGSALFLIDPPNERRKLRVTVPRDAGLIIFEYGGRAIAASRPLLEGPDPEDVAAALEDLPDVLAAEVESQLSGADSVAPPFLADARALDEVEPNTYEYSLDADQLVNIEVIPFRDTDEIAVESTISLAPYDPSPRDGSPHRLDTGDRARGILDGLTTTHEFSINLDTGDELEFRAASPSADLLLNIIGPDQEPWDGVTADDGGGGLYDLDAMLTYEATDTGEHIIQVTNLTITGTAYLLEISPL